LRLVIQYAETSYAIGSTGVGPVLSSLISPVFRHYYFVNRTKHVHLELLILLSGGSETGGGIDFDEPRLAVVIDEHIEAVEFKAVLVIDDDCLHTFERHYDEIVDVFEAARGLLSAVHHLQVEFQTLCGPLASVVSTVLLAVFLDGHIGQMHEHVVHLCNIRRVELVAKPPETFVIYVCSDGTIACN